MSGETWMMERAMEELNILEAQHPSRFDYLKSELRSLISDSSSFPNLISFSSSACTQVSSNRKRRGEELPDGDLLGFGSEKRRNMKRRSSEERAEMAIDRAMACLRRIRLLKESFRR